MPRHRVETTVSPEVFEEIERQRGQVPRERFVRRLIEDGLESGFDGKGRPFPTIGPRVRSSAEAKAGVDAVPRRA